MKVKFRTKDVFYVSIIYNIILCVFFHDKHIYVNDVLLFGGVFIFLLGMFVYLSIKGYIKNKEICLGMIIAIIQMIAYACSTFLGLPIGFVILRIAITRSSFCVYFIAAQRIELDEKDFFKILIMLILVSVFVSLFDIMINFSSFMKVTKNLYSVKYYGEYYTGFFGTRTESAYISFL